VAALPDDELPLHRSWLNQGSLPNARTLTSGAPNEILAELVEAIESRKIEADSPQLTVRRTIRQKIGWHTKSNRAGDKPPRPQPQAGDEPSRQEQAPDRPLRPRPQASDEHSTGAQ
jgi:hypothetical protein